MAHAPARSFVENLLALDGQLAQLIAHYDWAATSIGPIERWPESLKTVAGIILLTPVPMVLLWGEEGIMLYNDAYSLFAGARHPDLLGSKVREGWPEVADFNDNVMKVGLSGGTLQFRDQELTLYRSGAAEQVWMNLDYSPVLDEEGSPVGVLCILGETTERITAERRQDQAQAALRESEESHRFLLELSDQLRTISAPQDMTELTARMLGERLGASRAFYAEICGTDMRVEREYIRDVDSLIGTHSLEAFGPDLLRAYKDGETVAVSDVKSDPRFGDEARDGLGNREVAAFLDVVLFQEGQWVGLLAVQDRSPRSWTSAETNLVLGVAERLKSAIERARAEASLRELNDTLEQRVAERTAERNLLATLVETTDVMIMAADRDYNILAINTANADEFERIYGVKPKSGDNVLELLAGHPEHLEQVRAGWARGLSGEHVTFVEDFGDPNRARPYYEVNFRPLYDEAGALIGSYQFASDVTERLQREAQLEQAQEALRQAHKMEAVGQLTGGIAHDFNNLLGAVVGAFDLIRRQPSNVDRVRRWADNGMAAAERGAKLTSQLLAFARTQKLERKPVMVFDLVAGMRDLLDRTLGPMIHLDLQLSGDGAALSDPTQIEMAVLNLAINARDAMPDGGNLTIATATTLIEGDAELKSGEYVEVSVSDTGTGMSPDVASRALDPFFTTKEIGKGTGLGLSQVYGLARQTGGTVRIDSALGRGTTVRILLPATTARAASEPQKQPDLQRGQHTTGTVLIVDDDPEIRRVLVDLTEALGYGVVEASDGPSGLSELQRSTPDLMMIDFAMPGMNGAEVARRARELRPKLPIIFASGYSDTAAIESAVGEDAIMLRKPFRVDELQVAFTQAAATAGGGQD